MIRISNVNKYFNIVGGQLHVLRDIDLKIDVGQRIAIVGTSGAGKTTLMHIMGGLDRPTDGEVLFEERNLFALKGAALDAFRNQTIGFVFQFHQLLPEFTALENVMMPLLISGQSRSQARGTAADVLAETGLGKRLEHKPGALSGGEQQRVAIARALIQKPRLLLADEPTGNLDRRTSDEIFVLLEKLHCSHNLTMVIVTHNDQLAARMDRVVRIEDGRLVADDLN
ncbi:ABC transporter ATP-binding protein [Geopsychrobacter electrodiphilus]|uniref:ABC transporter ATP-binding protein n=1 Tax=Geopsychrobacter electrodiphilus TaxID=225196 RepID=UPI00036CF15C|nr:ABC transporter ATP-binding protein [Geopsychrobacter electrodiphilus]